MPDAAIMFPDSLDKYHYFSDLITQRHPMLEGAFGSIDGLSLVAQESDDPEIENATYNGWKTDHRVNNVFVFSPEGYIFLATRNSSIHISFSVGVIMSAVINAPGSWHDAHVARPIFQQLRNRAPDGYFLVADSAFPKGGASIAGKIQAPMKGGDRVPEGPAAQEYTFAYNRQLVSYRQTAEWGMRMLQGSFGRLRVPLPIRSAHRRTRFLENIGRLANIRARHVGINQIRTVYLGIWRESEEERLWTDLSNMVFGDIRKRDRVSRFHLVIAE